jgi:hypothetical protein
VLGGLTSEGGSQLPVYGNGYGGNYPDGHYYPPGVRTVPDQAPLAKSCFSAPRAAERRAFYRIPLSTHRSRISFHETCERGGYLMSGGAFCLAWRQHYGSDVCINSLPPLRVLLYLLSAADTVDLAASARCEHLTG